MDRATSPGSMVVGTLGKTRLLVQDLRESNFVLFYRSDEEESCSGTLEHRPDKIKAWSWSTAFSTFCVASTKVN
jgi:hypothetical protein